MWTSVGFSIYSQRLHCAGLCRWIREIEVPLFWHTVEHRNRPVVCICHMVSTRCNFAESFDFRVVLTLHTQPNHKQLLPPTPSLNPRGNDTLLPVHVKPQLQLLTTTSFSRSAMALIYHHHSCSSFPNSFKSPT